MNKFIIILLISLTFSYYSFSNYEKGYEAFIQQNYPLAIKYFNELIENKEGSAETWYYLGVCYLKLNKFELAKEAFLTAYDIDNYVSFVEHDKFTSNLRKAEDGIRASNIINNYKIKSILYWISIIITIIIVFFIAFNRLKKRKIYRIYKENKINNELLTNLYELNSDFKKAQKLILEYEEKETREYLEEVEERCIALNDRIAMLKYGDSYIEEENINREISYTRELLKKCMDKFSLVEKV